MARPARPHNPDDFQMSFGDHLEDLRKRLIHALVGCALICAVTLWYSRDIIALLLIPLVEAQHFLGFSTQLYVRSTVSGFTVFLKVGIIAGLLVSLPWIFFQAWRFIETGLYPHERRAVLMIAPLSAAMTVIGMAFMYFLFLPAMLAFLIQFTATYPQVQPKEGTIIRSVTRAFMRINNTLQVPGANQLPAENAPPDLPHPPEGLPPATRDSATGPSTMSIETLSPARLPMFDGDPPQLHEGDVWYNRARNQVRFLAGDRVLSLQVASDSTIVPMIDPNEYINEVAFTALMVVPVFQIPVLMMFLSMSGLVDPAWFSRYRKIFVFSCFVLAVILTPNQDVFSNVALPLIIWGLFEFGLLLMRMTYKRRDAEENRPL